jgi:hypothetical protein
VPRAVEHLKAEEETLKRLVNELGVEPSELNMDQMKTDFNVWCSRDNGPIVVVVVVVDLPMDPL